MRDRVMSFEIHSDPNAQSWNGYPLSIKPNWPAYWNSGRRVLVSNELDIITTKDYDIRDRCRFWHENSALGRNKIFIQDGAETPQLYG
jgi:hypothetical protein